MKIQSISLVFQKSILHISFHIQQLSISITRTFILKYFTEFVPKIIIIINSVGINNKLCTHQTHTHIYVFFFHENVHSELSAYMMYEPGLR